MRAFRDNQVNNPWRDLQSVQQERDQLLILYTKALHLLSACSGHTPDALKDQIEDLVRETSRTTLMPVRSVRFEGQIIIDADGVLG
jgi:starvation-inducible outer membrane lipoprotein